jgi:hypothetical protein
MNMDHPLMKIKMSLFEISHRDIEKIEKMRYKIVSNTKGEFDTDIEEFKEFLFNIITSTDE